MLFAQVQQAMNAAAKAELCYISTGTYVACKLQARIFPACMSMWVLKKNPQKLVRPWPEQPDWLRVTFLPHEMKQVLNLSCHNMYTMTYTYMYWHLSVEKLSPLTKN